MRKHGWQLPYHPLQVVAVAVFLALAFAFYVFFAPFVGTKMFQYVAMGLYTPLITCVFGLYVWCAAANPADPGVFKSKKYLSIPENEKHEPKHSKLGGESTSSIHDANGASVEGTSLDQDVKGLSAMSRNSSTRVQEKNTSPACLTSLLAFFLSPCALMFKCSGSSDELSEQQLSEDGMFYCSLCEVEVNRHSKHCRVCDKCVDCFDHHCRWLNNCVGKRNYRKFFTLMVFSLLLLILQSATGIIVLICCFLKHNRFSVDIATKLGSSFSLVPFVIVVSVCTILAMIATLPLAQLFFFHILLIKKGISTYDYIIALREQEQEQQGVGVQQSPRMSPASSLTGLSSASSFNTFHRGAWCTPPRLFVEDQFDVVPPETASVSSFGKKTVREEPVKKKNPTPVKISPWALARLNAEEITKAAAQARKKSKTLQPVVKRNKEPECSIGNSRKRSSKRIRLPADEGFNDTSRTLAPLQHEARSAFQASRGSAGFVASSSPESSLDSPDMHPFWISSPGGEEVRRLAGLSVAAQRGIIPLPLPLPIPKSSSDGYEASGGEDSDRVPSRIVERSATNWSKMLFGYDQDGEGVYKLKAASSSNVNNTMV